MTGGYTGYIWLKAVFIVDYSSEVCFLRTIKCWKDMIDKRTGSVCCKWPNLYSINVITDVFESIQEISRRTK